MNEIRLNRFLASAGFGARRKCDLMVADGRVKVNGVAVLKHGLIVRVGWDRVEVDGVAVDLPDAFVYLLLHKPTGVLVTMSDPFGRLKVPDLLPEISGRLFPVGRLDKDSSGVLLLTGDGELANRLIHPAFKVPKEYRVTIDRRWGSRECQALADGIELDEGLARASGVAILDASDERTVISLTLTQGWKRQIRRMVEVVGAEVTALERTSFAGLTTGGLLPGTTRELETAEVEQLRRLAAL
jgi:pseudouridine synthase